MNTETVVLPRGKGMRFSNGVFALVVLVIGLIQLYPLVWLIDYSLCRSGELFVSGVFALPKEPQFQNYVRAWTDGNILRYFINSVIVTGISILLTVILSAMISYVLTRMKWKYAKLFTTILMIGMLIPIHATLIPNFMIYSKLGWLNEYISLILPYTAFQIPLSVLVYSGFMESIPRSLEESAVMDGSSLPRALFRIILPVCKPATMTVTVMAFMACWNEYIMAATFASSDKLYTLPFAVTKFQGMYSGDYAVQFAAMVITVVPALLIYIFLNKFITKGITMGAVKG